MLQIFKASPSVLKFDLLNSTALLHPWKCCMNRLATEKSISKMSFCKVLHGIQSGNDGDLDTARSLYTKILCIRERPLSFQGKAPEESLQNLAGSLGHVTTSLGTLCVELLCRK